ncbi:hypothetical protein D3C73_940260 [compost metagenome]
MQDGRVRPGTPVPDENHRTRRDALDPIGDVAHVAARLSGFDITDGDAPHLCDIVQVSPADLHAVARLDRMLRDGSRFGEARDISTSGAVGAPHGRQHRHARRQTQTHRPPPHANLPSRRMKS